MWYILHHINNSIERSCCSIRKYMCFPSREILYWTHYNVRDVTKLCSLLEHHCQAQPLVGQWLRTHRPTVGGNRAALVSIKVRTSSSDKSELLLLNCSNRNTFYTPKWSLQYKLSTNVWPCPFAGQWLRTHWPCGGARPGRARCCGCRRSRLKCCRP